MPPFASADAGAETSRLLDVPWVADLRDAWALDELEGYLSRFHYYGELRHMERTLRRADAIVWNTEESLRRARLSLRGLPQRQLAIRNGYDPAEFAEASPPRTDGQFRIVHTGTFLTDHAVSLGRAAGLRRALGGAAPADARGRSPIYLMAALDLLLSRRPDLMGRIEVHLAGELSKEDHDATRAELVYTHGHLARSESLALIRSADLLFLPMHRLPAGMRSSSAPGKTYEYLGSGRPVLAAVPGGDVRDVIAAAGNGYVCDPDDVHAIASAIEQECDRWARGEPLRRPDPAVLAQHQRQAQAAILATVFEDVLRGTNAAREERRPDDARDRTKAQPSRSTRST
jgi:glycosyltransferase involved in cell wall biosynthesis